MENPCFNIPPLTEEERAIEVGYATAFLTKFNTFWKCLEETTKSNTKWCCEVLANKTINETELYS